MAISSASYSSPSTDSPLHLLERARVRTGEGESRYLPLSLTFGLALAWALSFVITRSPLKACPERSRRIRGARGVMSCKGQSDEVVASPSVEGRGNLPDLDPHRHCEGRFLGRSNLLSVLSSFRVMPRYSLPVFVFLVPFVVDLN